MGPRCGLGVLELRKSLARARSDTYIYIYIYIYIQVCTA